MVVVILVAILAVMAAPAMRVAKDDRVTFDYARQLSQIVHRARARAAARGGAHLVTIDPGATGRGRFLLFEALDGSVAADGGPRPVSSCKGTGQWAEVSAFAPGVVGTRALIVEGLDLNTGDTPGVVNYDANIFASTSVGGVAATFVALCVTPAGVVYFGSAGDLATAITTMQTSLPFSNVLDVSFQRHVPSQSPAAAATASAGLARSVIVTSGGAPRIRSR